MKLKTVLLLIGTPSTTNSGLLLEKDDSPRMLIRDEDPTPVAPCVMVTPASLPERLSRKFTDLTSSIASEFMVCTVYPSSRVLRFTPSAVTTISFNPSKEFSRTILRVV